MPRLPVALVATVLSLAVAAGPASAGETEPLPEREVRSEVRDLGNRLVFKGNVDPGHARKPVIIQKRNCTGDDCSWYAWRTVRTNDRGGFRQRIAAPEDGYWYWRAKVGKHGGWATSYSIVWRTWTD